MKKVKKNWVVVSISSFAFFGATGFTLMNGGVNAHADYAQNSSAVVVNGSNSLSNSSHGTSAYQNSQSHFDELSSSSNSSVANISSNYQASSQTNNNNYSDVISSSSTNNSEVYSNTDWDSYANFRDRKSVV